MLNDQATQTKPETVEPPKDEQTPLQRFVHHSFNRDGVTIYNADCRQVLPVLDPESVNCCVTSPPYWGLRDYGHDDQIGNEAMPEEYVAAMVDVFRAVRRVLRDDGTVWLNLGDTYAGRWGAMSYPGDSIAGRRFGANNSGNVGRPVNSRLTGDLKEKDLVGIPWLVAFALRADGWYLRQDIIWHKPNPMPESVKDRCTKAHEYIFLLTKSQRYHFETLTEQGTGVSGGACFGKVNQDGPGSRRIDDSDNERIRDGQRNKRSVWSVTVKPYSGAHFATFPPDLIEPCIRAGCPEGGTVLDPFLGSGTTAEVAQRNGCRAVGCELNAEYVSLAVKRFEQRPLFVG